MARAASAVVVDLYRIAYNAGRPVTFDELVDGLPSAYQNDANRWWLEEHEGYDIPPEPWSASHRRKVKCEWVAKLVSDMTGEKRFYPSQKDGRPARYKGALPRSELVYEAVKEIPRRGGKGGPPMVYEEYLARRLVRWTPEIGATGRRHMAGVQFMDEVRRLERLGKDTRGATKASKAELEAAIAMAVDALSVIRSSS
jgi:hypothetical protein